MAESPGTAVTSTCRVRRRDLESAGPGEVRSGTSAMLPGPPPLPATPPGRFGDLTRTSVEEITGLAAQPPVPVPAPAIANRRDGVRMILRHLAGSGGVTWQERWEAAGLDDPDRPVAGLSSQPRTRRLLACGMRMLFQWRVVRPGLAALHANHLTGYAEPFRQMQDDLLLDAFFDLADASSESHIAKLAARFDITAAMTTSGICLAGMTPQGLLCYGIQSRPLVPAGVHGMPGRQAWHFLHLMGHFPASVPATMRWPAYRGQRSVTEMAGRYEFSNAGVRDLLIDYITRRAAGIDYSTTETLAQALAGLFWSAIETINPAQQDLRLSQATYEQWKAEISVLPDGQPRKNFDALQLTVRSFYLDLQSWAVTEPERRARWAAPCPVRDTGLRGLNARRRRVVEQMAGLTRERQPLLPVPAGHAGQHHRDLESLLAATREALPGQEFTHHGHHCRRTSSRHDQDRARAEGAMPARVIDQVTGRMFNVALEEDRAFWEWAIVETLRHSGPASRNCLS